MDGLPGGEDPRHPSFIFNTVQIESTREGDDVLFNDQSYPATATEVTETAGEKHITLEGNKGAIYKLCYERETGVIDFQRVSGGGRRLAVEHYAVVNRPPRPFDRADQASQEYHAVAGREIVHDLLRAYAKHLLDAVDTSPPTLIAKNAEEYRDVIVVMIEADFSGQEAFELVGREVELVARAIDWVESIGIHNSSIRDASKLHKAKQSISEKSIVADKQ